MDLKYRQLVDFNDYFITKPEGDASFDLRVASVSEIVPNGHVLCGGKQEFIPLGTDSVNCFVLEAGKEYSIGTGIALEIPDGYFGMLSLRSSFGRAGFILMNAPGVIDAGFRNEVLATVMLVVPQNILVPKWYRAVQMTIVPKIATNLIQVAKLSDSERGMGGFGSTGGV